MFSQVKYLSKSKIFDLTDILLEFKSNIFDLTDIWLEFKSNIFDLTDIYLNSSRIYLTWSCLNWRKNLGYLTWIKFEFTKTSGYLTWIIFDLNHKRQTCPPLLRSWDIIWVTWLLIEQCSMTPQPQLFRGGVRHYIHKLSRPYGVPLLARSQTKPNQIKPNSTQLNTSFFCNKI